MPFKALIADDDPIVRDWLRNKLIENFDLTEDQVKVTGSTSDAIDISKRFSPDLVLMDIKFGHDDEANGIGAAKTIWALHPKTAIIFISNYADKRYVKDVYLITPPTCVYGYMLKKKIVVNVSDFVEAVKTVLQEEDCWIDPEIKRVADRLNVPRLSERDYQVLICIALGLTDKRAGGLLYITEKAVQQRLRKVYAKCGIPPNLGNPRAQAVAYGFEHGLITARALEEWRNEYAGQLGDQGPQ